MYSFGSGTLRSVFERLFDVAEMGVLMYGYILLLAFCATLVIQMVKLVREKNAGRFVIDSSLL